MSVENDLLVIIAPLIASTITLGGVMYKIGEWFNKKSERKTDMIQRYTDEKWSSNHASILELNERFNTVERKQDERAAYLKAADEDTAKELKEHNERIASGIAKVATDTAFSLSKVALDTAGSVAKVATDTALTLKENNEKIAVGLKENTKDMAITLKENNAGIAAGLKENNEKIAQSLKENNAQTSELIKSQLTESTEKLNLVLRGLAERADLVNGNVASIRTDIADLQEDLLDLYSGDDLDYQREDNGRDVEIDHGRGRDGLSARKNRKRLDTSRRRLETTKRRKIEADRVNQAEKQESYRRVTKSRY